MKLAAACRSDRRERELSRSLYRCISPIAGRRSATVWRGPGFCRRLVLGPALLVSIVAWGAPPLEVDLFHAGEGGYHTYRIPALLVTPKGTLLAFCEGR